MKNPNKKGLEISNLAVKHISTSKKTGYGMYVITFNIGQKKYAQTRHMSAKAAENFVPRVEVVQSGERTLQKCSFKVCQK